jgi:hypothetical protein
MGDELRSVGRLASTRDRTLSGLDAGEPGTEHGALHDRAKLVESRTLRVLGRVVGAQRVRAADPARAAVDYEGTLRQVHASPPSLAVDLPARPQTVVFRRVPDAGPWASRLGFSLHSDAQVVDDGDGVGGPVTARADRDVARRVHRPTRPADAAAAAASHPAARHCRAVAPPSAASWFYFFRSGVAICAASWCRVSPRANH